jgi:hypothetical protein
LSVARVQLLKMARIDDTKAAKGHQDGASAAIFEGHFKSASDGAMPPATSPANDPAGLLVGIGRVPP